MADAYSPTESFLANMNSIQLKSKDLLRFHYGYHVEQVSIATRYIADGCCIREPQYQI